MSAALAHIPRAAGEGSREAYQPSNGIEGACFMAEFCDRCERDAAYRAGTGDSCPIVTNTMVYDETDDAYPREWVYGADGNPTCTAFTPTNPKGQPNV